MPRNMKSKGKSTPLRNIIINTRFYQPLEQEHNNEVQLWATQASLTDYTVEALLQTGFDSIWAPKLQQDQDIKSLQLPLGQADYWKRQ